MAKLETPCSPLQFGPGRAQMRSRIGKNRDFGVHLGANWRLKTSSFLTFSKTRSFIFNKLVASVVSKNNLFAFLLSLLSGRPFDFPTLPRLVPKSQPRVADDHRLPRRGGDVK